MAPEKESSTNGDVTRSETRDWLEVLCLGLDRVGVTVVACRACAGDCLIVLGESRAEKRPPFEVSVTRNVDEPAYAVVTGLAIRYRGAEELRPDHRYALQVISRLIEKLSSKIPLDLDSSFVKGNDRLPPHQALSFSFPFCTAERSDGPNGPEVSEVLVRVTSRCNQACPFCSAPPEMSGGDPSAQVIGRLISDLDRLAPATTCTLTGGEPSLRRDLPALVRLALDSPSRRLNVKIQTNAVRFQSRELLDGIGRSSRLTFFVSYHATEARKYDLCTGTTGMLQRARTGIANLLICGHHVVLSIVANAVNSNDLVVWVEDVAERFASKGSLGVHFSTTLCPAHRIQAEEWIIDYEQLAPRLESAYDRAKELGLEPEPLLSSTHAAIPACFLSSSCRVRKGAGLVVEPRVSSDKGPRRGTYGWVKASRCDECSFTSSCVGIPRAYARRFGTGSLRPIR